MDTRNAAYLAGNLKQRQLVFDFINTRLSATLTAVNQMLATKGKYKASTCVFEARLLNWTSGIVGQEMSLITLKCNVVSQ